MIPRPLRPARDSVFMFAREESNLARCVGPGSFSPPSRNVVKVPPKRTASLQCFVPVFDISCLLSWKRPRAISSWSFASFCLLTRRETLLLPFPSSAAQCPHPAHSCASSRLGAPAPLPLSSPGMGALAPAVSLHILSSFSHMASTRRGCTTPWGRRLRGEETGHGASPPRVGGETRPVAEDEEESDPRGAMLGLGGCRAQGARRGWTPGGGCEARGEGRLLRPAAPGSTRPFQPGCLWVSN